MSCGGVIHEQGAEVCSEAMPVEADMLGEHFFGSAGHQLNHTACPKLLRQLSFSTEADSEMCRSPWHSLTSTAAGFPNWEALSLDSEHESDDAMQEEVSVLQLIPYVDDGNKAPRSSSKIADWSFGRALGQGRFATVFAAKNEGNRRNEAAKVISKSEVEAADDWANVANEYEALRSFGPHPNIVCLTGAWQSQQHIYFFMDLASGKDLFDFIKLRQQNGKPVAKDAIQTISTCILGALAHCHQHGICHRDLKPENIMVQQDYTAKLVDFGCACPRYQLQGQQCTGTVPFIAPECLNEQAHDGAPADVWSFGVVILEMKFGLHALSRFLAWDKAMPTVQECGAQLKEVLTEPARALQQLQQKLNPGAADADGDDILAQMLHADPSQRPLAADLS